MSDFAVAALHSGMGRALWPLGAARRAFRRQFRRPASRPSENSAPGGRRAREQQPAVAAVITFDPHPLKVLRPQQAPPLVQTLGAATRRLRRHLGSMPRWSCVSTAPWLRSRPRSSCATAGRRAATAEVLVGANFRFGHASRATSRCSKTWAAQFGFSVQIVEPVVIDGEVVSSTGVRRAVAEGRVADAARLLGRPFALTGEIAAARAAAAPFSSPR